MDKSQVMAGGWEGGKTKTFQAKIEALSRRSSNDLHPPLGDICSVRMGFAGVLNQHLTSVNQHQLLLLVGFL
jgi:hypothetical protein